MKWRAEVPPWSRQGPSPHALEILVRFSSVQSSCARVLAAQLYRCDRVVFQVAGMNSAGNGLPRSTECDGWKLPGRWVAGEGVRLPFRSRLASCLTRSDGKIVVNLLGF